MRGTDVARAKMAGLTRLPVLLALLWPGEAAAQAAPDAVAGKAAQAAPDAEAEKAAAQEAPDAEAGSPGIIRLDVARAGGAELCPRADYFENRITALLDGEDPFSPEGPLRLLVTLEPSAGGYRGRAELTTRDGTRVYEREMRVVDECTVLAAGLAVGFAQTWRTMVGRVRKPKPAEAPEEPPPATAPPPTTPPPPRAAPEVSSSPGLTPPPVRLPVCKLWIGGYCLIVDIYSFGLSAGALMTLGYTADVGPGAYMGAELRPSEHFSFELQLRGTFPARVVASEPIDPNLPYESPKEPDFSSVTMLLVPCFRYSWFMGCVVGQFGFNIFQTPVEAILTPGLGAGPRFGAEIPFLERFAVRVWGDVIFQLPNRHRLDDVNLAWTQSPVVGMVGAGLAVNFK